MDLILHGGDIFDRPDISPSLVRELVLILNNYSIPIYAVAGNHDIYGQNPLTINRTMLGLLDSIGLIRLIKPDEKIFFEKDSIKLQLSGQHYFYGIDREGKKRSYIIDKSPHVDFAVIWFTECYLKNLF